MENKKVRKKLNEVVAMLDGKSFIIDEKDTKLRVEMAKLIKDSGKEALKDAKEKIDGSMSIEDIEKAIDELKSKGKDGVDYVSKNIKDEPLKSVGITLAVGFVLGWLFRK